MGFPFDFGHFALYKGNIILLSAEATNEAWSGQSRDQQYENVV